MKAMNLQYIMHCTNSNYWLITIHRADDTLIHIKPSNILMKWLLKQKDKPKSIKIRVNQIHQALLLLNGVNHHMISNLIKWWSLRTDGKEDKKEDNKVQREIMLGAYCHMTLNSHVTQHKWESIPTYVI